VGNSEPPLFPANYVADTGFLLRIRLSNQTLTGKIAAMSRSASRGGLDDVSMAIIKELQQDGRRAYATIGKAVGLSEAAVRQRVQKLVDTGVMQIVAVTDPLQLGFATQAMIAVSVTGDVEQVAAELETLDEVDYIVVTAGSFDLLVEVVVEDDAHLLSLVNGRIRAIAGVTRTESFLYLKLVKQTYNWGAR
jgi:Lrp/AsnC family transcriptional regulator, regulator for asnA, asnC and gidA